MIGALSWLITKTIEDFLIFRNFSAGIEGLRNTIKNIHKHFRYPDS